MPADQRTRLKQWLDSGEAQLHPLTLPQRELWEVSPVPVEDSANHICCLIKVQGLLTEQQCRAALRAVVDRDDVLRLSILPGRERPLQMIRKRSEINFAVREVPDASPEAMEELAVEIFRTPFDLVQGPLYRVVDLRRTPNDHLLVFAIHHAVADGWSLGIFIEGLFAAYLQAITGASEPLPPVPQTYAAWGAAERAFWKPEILEQRLEFWKGRLAASSRMWNATIPVGPPQRWLSAIPASLTNETRELARRTGITLFSALFGAFQIAFSKWSGFDDLVVGTPIANRTRQTARETMGYYAGIVPLRGQTDLSRVASDHLRASHQVTIDSFANAVPFVELVRGIGEQPAAGYNPLFEVRFALQNHPMPEVSLPNLSARLSMRSTGTARFQLGCEITENREGLEVAWLFRENLFSQDDIESLNGIFQRVLAGISRSPESRISEVLNRPQ
jgi:hypothetical protein